MVRAYGDKPVRRVFLRAIGQAAELRNEEGKAVLFPGCDVYQFNPSLFERLLEASKKGKAKDLWEKCHHYAIAS